MRCQICDSDTNVVSVFVEATGKFRSECTECNDSIYETLNELELDDDEEDQQEERLY